MLYAISDLKSRTVAYISPKALVSYYKRLYINYKTKVSVTPDLSTGRTVRLVKLTNKVIVDFSTVPKDIRVPVMDDYPILSVGFKPAHFGDIVIAYGN